MKNPDKIKIAQESSKILSAHLSQFTLDIFNTKDSEDHYDWLDTGLFSATLVEIGNRLFACTAAHCVDEEASLSRYWILDDNVKHVKNHNSCVIAAHCNPNKNPDVGIIELNRSCFLSSSTKKPCGVDRIHICGPGRSDRLACLIGLPNVLKEKHKDSTGEVVGVTSRFFGYNSFPFKDTNEIWEQTQPASDRDIDILLDYPKNDITRVDTGQPYSLPDPYGMSGGGLWDHGFDPDKLWSCDHAILIGVQSHWNENKRYVRAVQIIYWLRLVYSRYPDLRHILESKFPALGHDVTE